MFLGFLEFCVFCCCGTSYYTQALKGGGVLLKSRFGLVSKWSQKQKFSNFLRCKLMAVSQIVGSSSMERLVPLSIIITNHQKENSLKFFFQTHVCMCHGLFVWFFLCLAFVFGVYHKL